MHLCKGAVTAGGTDTTISAGTALFILAVSKKTDIIGGKEKVWTEGRCAMIYSISEIHDILKRELCDAPVKQAILFGAYAKGCPREESDLDLVVDMNGSHQNFAFWGVYEALCSVFSIPVELFERSEIVPGQEADQEIRRTGVVVYDRSFC